MYTCSEHGWQSFYYPCPGCVVTTSGVTTSDTQPLKEPISTQSEIWEQVEQAFMDYMPKELKEYLMNNFLIIRKPN